MVIGDHVADDQLAAVRLQIGQHVFHLAVAAQGDDLHAPLQQVAQDVGGLGDVLKAHDGVAVLIVFHQLDAAQHVVDGDFDLHHRQGRIILQHFRRAAAGNDDVVTALVQLIDQVDGFLQVSLPDVQENSFHIVRHLGQDDAHARIGRDGQGADRGCVAHRIDLLRFLR